MVGRDGPAMECEVAVDVCLLDIRLTGYHVYAFQRISSSVHHFPMDFKKNERITILLFAA